MHEANHYMPPPIEDLLTQHQKDVHFFLENVRGAEFHWFFIQTVNALDENKWAKLRIHINTIKSDVQKQSEAVLLHAGYLER